MQSVSTEDALKTGGHVPGIPNVGQPRANAERRKKIGLFVLVVAVGAFWLLRPDSITIQLAREWCPSAPKDAPGCALVPPNPRPGQITGIAAYSYKRGSRNGPLNWGSLDCGNRFHACSYCNNTCNGHMQSPVNIHTRSAKTVARTEAPRISLIPAEVEYTMTPGNFELLCSQPGTCGNVTHHNRTYLMSQVHMHHLSEHDMDGFKFPLEMHFVHTHHVHLLVLALFFDVGPKCNPDLQVFLDVARERCRGQLDIPALVGASFYRPHLVSYQGSTTTPPCTEGVTFVLSTRTQYVCLRQIREFARLEGNQLEARPLQPLNGRTPTVYK